MNNTLYVVIPCYKEEAVLPETAVRLKEKMTALSTSGKISPKSRVLFVNDGSTDNTWQIIRELHRNDPLFCGVDLSRNRGHQNALLAGLTIAVNDADIIISMDADLQDDINAIDEMIECWINGCDVVYGVRSSRKKDTAFKRFTAKGFYKFMKAMGVEIVFNHADYRLMSRRATEALLQFDETNLFLRGMVPLVGFRSTTVEYERAERFAGESKYPLKKMISFALDGITSFSIKPIRAIGVVGLVFCLFALGALVWSLVAKLTGNVVEVWSSLMISIWFVGGVQILCLGVIGEYIGKIYSETKHRPKFIIRQILDDQSVETDEKSKNDALL